MLTRTRLQIWRPWHSESLSYCLCLYLNCFVSIHNDCRINKINWLLNAHCLFTEKFVSDKEIRFAMTWYWSISTKKRRKSRQTDKSTHKRDEQKKNVRLYFERSPSQCILIVAQSQVCVKFHTCVASFWKFWFIFHIMCMFLLNFISCYHSW